MAVILACITCGASFADRQVILGRERHLHGRLQCLKCVPFKPRRSPNIVTHKAPKTLVCQNCGKNFPAKVEIDGKIRSLYGRRFCLECSPFGAHNTSKAPPGGLLPAELEAHRRRRRGAKFYRYQKKKRKAVKARLIAELGGCCVDCGYAANPKALEFHHRDASTKEFTISKLVASLPYARLLVEARKCDLLCANCHRLRHAAQLDPDAITDLRVMARELKARAVALMGSSCAGCGTLGPNAIFEFHHRVASTKDFGIGEDGRIRSWDAILAELAKCVMLCANCHREVHAGVRTLDAGLAEDALPYAA